MQTITKRRSGLSIQAEIKDTLNNHPFKQLSVTGIRKALNLTEQQAADALRALREAGLVKANRVGMKTIIEIL